VPGPRWRWLYGLTLLALTAQAAVEIVGATGVPGTLLRCAVPLIGVAAMALWVRRNRTELDLESWCACASAEVTARVIPSPPPAVLTLSPDELGIPWPEGIGTEEPWVVPAGR
jgi:hypothetical protein